MLMHSVMIAQLSRKFRQRYSGIHEKPGDESHANGSVNLSENQQKKRERQGEIHD